MLVHLVVGIHDECGIQRCVGQFRIIGCALDDRDVFDTVLLQTLAEPRYRTVVDIDGEHASIRSNRPGQPTGEESVACSDVGDARTRPDAHLGENYVNVLPLLAATFLGRSILGKHGSRRDQARKTDPLKR